MTEAEKIKERTRVFAVSIVRLTQSLPRTHTAWTLGDQLLRSGTSVGANYRAACRARSRREFIAKLGIVEEEADETLFWLDLLKESGFVTEEGIGALRHEGRQLLAITVASIRTARRARPSNPQSTIRTPQFVAIRVPRSQCS